MVAFPVGSDTPGHRRIAALKAAGTPVEISNGAGGAAETLAALLRPLLAPVATAPVAGIANLPLIELPAEHHGPFLAIVLSGDGGWRDVDKGVAEKLQSDGVSVVGWDSLRYFWSKKSPEQTARDLSAVIDTYVSRWNEFKVALVGYSFGADVLPFAYNHLSPEAKVRVVQLSLLGFAPAADFEISIAGWLGVAPGKDALATVPALAPIDPTMVQCFYGATENDSACPLISRKGEIIRTAGATISTMTTTLSREAFSVAFTGAGNSGSRSLQSGGKMEATSSTTEVRINERRAAALFRESLSAFGMI